MKYIPTFEQFINEKYELLTEAKKADYKPNGPFHKNYAIIIAQELKPLIESEFKKQGYKPITSDIKKRWWLWEEKYAVEFEKKIDGQSYRFLCYVSYAYGDIMIGSGVYTSTKQPNGEFVNYHFNILGTVWSNNKAIPLISKVTKMKNNQIIQKLSKSIPNHVKTFTDTIEDIIKNNQLGNYETTEVNLTDGL
jgi:hypothetical protein